MTRGCVAGYALKLLMLAAVASAGQGCGMPGWLRHVPSSRDTIYAIGTGDPGWWNPQEAAAVRSAEKELGRTIRTRVRSVLIVRNIGSKDYVDEVSDEFSDIVVKNAQLEGKWLDEKGRMGVENRLYVLMSFNRSNFIDSLKKTAIKTAEKRKETVSAADIEKAARQAFDELDKAINKKNLTYERKAGKIPR